jgi:hypothetical protein
MPSSSIHLLFRNEILKDCPQHYPKCSECSVSLEDSIKGLFKPCKSMFPFLARQIRIPVYRKKEGLLLLYLQEDASQLS